MRKTLPPVGPQADVTAERFPEFTSEREKYLERYKRLRPDLRKADYALVVDELFNTIQALRYDLLRATNLFYLETRKREGEPDSNAHYRIKEINDILMRDASEETKIKIADF